MNCFELAHDDQQLTKENTKSTVICLDDVRISDTGATLDKVVQRMEKEGRQIEVELWKSLMAEQASLRYLIESQHERIFQMLSSWKNGNVQESAEEQQTVTNVFDENGNGKAQADQDRKRTDLALAAGNGVVLDTSKLPDQWTVFPDLPTEDEQIPLHVRSWHRCVNFVRSGAFDAIFISVIFLNLISVCLQLQWRGYNAAMLMDKRGDDNGWSQASEVFDGLELVYTSVFTLEAVLRLTFLGRDYLCVPANLFDTLIVVVTCVQMYILQPAGIMKDGSFVAVARLIRLVRVMRFLKVVKFAEACAELRILARALSGCLGSLFWSMMLLAALIVAGSIVLFQLVLAYIEDESNPDRWREWSFETLGTMPLCMMALWEATFTASWFRYSRVMIIQMNTAYALFWVPYIVCINFSVMRLIGALFLKETMAVASVDAEKNAIARKKRQRNFAEKIREVFEEADHSGDGLISADEFQDMLFNARVGACFENLDLEVYEVGMLFELLAADDGTANYHEFLEGALKLKQSAQTIDVIQLIHGNQKLSRAVDSIAKAVGAPVTTKTMG
mmetsp:Transcript_54844/g.100554  ORF Transcript_54844/g.100554 Transcript_54844/m.100554 type:complete len:561 (-) Transcript_54844:107-1789(-)